MRRRADHHPFVSLAGACVVVATLSVGGCAASRCPVGFVLRDGSCFPDTHDGGGDAGTESGSRGSQVESCDGADEDRDMLDDAVDSHAHDWCNEPGRVLPNARAKCDGTECVVESCDEPHLDCESAPGCETDSRNTLEHCGSCNVACAWECAESACNDVVQLSTGWAYNCALRANGSVVCWGWGADGRLGNASGQDASIPLPIAGLTDVVEISAGEHHACARERDGEVWCWGRNDGYQVGTRVGSYHSTPILTLPSSVGAVQLAAGGFFTCARTGAGRVLCWGSDNNGEVGDGAAVRTPGVDTPFDVGLEDVTQITTGTWHACALRASQRVVCWGANFAGQLGDGTRTSRHSVPTEDIPGLLATSIDGGNLHTCAIRTNGRMVCWGSNQYGPLGIGSELDQLTPGSDVESLAGVQEIEAGHAFSCARRGGDVFCWGQHNYGALGLSVSADSSTPALETPVLRDAVEISANGRDTCARRASGEVLCWGRNTKGQVGNGMVSEAEFLPVVVLPPAP